MYVKCEIFTGDSSHVFESRDPASLRRFENLIRLEGLWYRQDKAKKLETWWNREGFLKYRRARHA